MEKKRKKRYGYLFLSMLILILVIPVAIQRMSAAVLDSAETMGSETAHVYALNEVAVTNQYETVLETLEYQLRPENRTDSYEKLIQQYLKFADEVMGLDDAGTGEKTAPSGRDELFSVRFKRRASEIQSYCEKP